MPVTVRGSKFQATVNHKGSRYRKQFPTAQDAQVWELETKSKLVTGNYSVLLTAEKVPKVSCINTLREGIEYTYKHAWHDLPSGMEMKRNAYMVAEILGKDRTLESIDKRLIDSLIWSFKEKGNKNGTINRKLTALSKILSIAVDLDIISKRPKIPYLKEAPHRLRWYTDDEITKMIGYCTENEHKVFAWYLAFMVDTGLRQGEAAALRWEDLHWEDAIYIPNSKNGLPRAVPLTKRAISALNFMRDGHVLLKARMQYDHEGNYKNIKGPWQCMTPNHLRQRWTEVRNYMGWKDDPQAVLHTLRHTFCSRLIQLGAPLKMVQELAGHKRIEMTLRYSHLAPHNLSSCIDLLN
tara:strand:+ start:63 stop:1118 length:1056 start_codon:yes stop_codon:yes gene_type:complete